MKISSVVKNNLCVSCGLCAGVCPKKCISSLFDNGSYLPTIDENSCVNCGICHKICPGKSADYSTVTSENILFGNAIKCLAVQTKNQQILLQSTSGGVITTLIKNLLHDKIFDAAFLVDTYNHENETFTQLYSAESDFKNTPKSRYITVNQSHAVRYMLENPDKKLILVGTPCFIQGVLKIISHFKLNRENYFLAGLFCDKTMNYNVWAYFKKFLPLDNLHFRDKTPNGYPGDVALESQGKKYFLPRKFRMQVKDFFCVERCLYCIDKLNQFADISFGDNYTETPLPAQINRKAGTSNVIIRTALGAKIFNHYLEKFFICEIPAEEIYKSQHVDARIKNFIFSEYKSAQFGYSINKVPPKFSYSVYENPTMRREYESLMIKQKMGREKFFPSVAVEMWKVIS